MESKKQKLIMLIVFVAIIIGGGGVMYLWKLKGNKTIRTKGYRTQFNPAFMDSVIESKTHKSRK
jgi:hypothetical protein